VYVYVCVRLGERQRKKTRKRERTNRIKKKGRKEEVGICIVEA